MAIIGAYIDRTAGITLVGPTTTTFAHSVGTTPDYSYVNIRSIGAASSVQQPYVVGANGSLATVAVNVASGGVAAGSPATIQVDLYNQLFHSIIR